MTMSDQSQYRWLHQQGEAFGSPGMEPRWTSSVKDAVGTAYAASSRIWFTCSHGILNEVYHPTIDHPQVRDMDLYAHSDRLAGLDHRRPADRPPRPLTRPFTWTKTFSIPTTSP